jgi:hypothetical protein
MKRLFLEQRIDLVRHSLNRESMYFYNALTGVQKDQFRDYMLKLISILDGLPDDVVDGELVKEPDNGNAKPVEIQGSSPQKSE